MRQLFLSFLFLSAFSITQVMADDSCFCPNLSKQIESATGIESTFNPIFSSNIHNKAEDKGISSDWIIFTTRVKQEKFRIQFPLSFQTGFSNDDDVTIQVAFNEEQTLFYILTVIPRSQIEQNGPMRDEQILQILLNGFTENCDLLNHQQFDKDDLNYLDAELFCEEEQRLNKVRVIISKHNAYILMTQYAQNILEQHEYFINSFELTQ